MVAIRQQDHATASSSRLASAYRAAARASARASASASARTRAPRPVRWGAAVVESGPTKSLQMRDFRHDLGGSQVRRLGGHVPTLSASTGRQSVVERGQVSTLAAPVAAPALPSSFTQNRIRHAFELFGACMMIVTFLVLAMFA